MRIRGLHTIVVVRVRGGRNSKWFMASNRWLVVLVVLCVGTLCRVCIMGEFVMSVVVCGAGEFIRSVRVWIVISHVCRAGLVRLSWRVGRSVVALCRRRLGCRHSPHAVWHW